MFWGDDLVWQKRSRELAIACQVEREFNERCMRAGPFLAKDGYTLVVPSNIYNEQAAHFWRDKGFGFDREQCCWMRDTRRPLAGKRYAPAVWLERTRAKFYQFYPQYTPKEDDHG